MKLLNRSTKREVVIAPQCDNLNEFISNLPSLFEQEGRVIHDSRNQIRVFDVGGQAINVKRFCTPPYFFNRIVYRLFRDPKAKRSYLYGSKLLEMGINTPAPIAYIVEHEGLLMGRSYFVSQHLLHQRDMREFTRDRVVDAEARLILSEFGKFSAFLHSKGVYHYDYSPGNILFKMEEGRAKFSIVDVNRIKFEEVSRAKGCRNFSRLWCGAAAFEIVAESYASALGIDPHRTLNTMLKVREKFSRKLSLKRRYRNAFSTLKQKFVHSSS